MTTDPQANSTADPTSATLDDFHSADPPMMRCLELARVAAETDLPVLILGESGAGKTLLARAIHNSSARGKGPFIAFNAAALSDTLLDSQLFGHERGAFTGAQKTVKGKFEMAHNGTLFIDEIADMTASAQANSSGWAPTASEKRTCVLSPPPICRSINSSAPAAFAGIFFIA